MKSCSDLHRELQTPLLGSAPEVDVFVWFECRRPWQSRVERSADFPGELAEVVNQAAAAAGRRARTVARPSVRADGTREARVYRRTPEGEVRLVRLHFQEEEGPRDRLAAAVTGEEPGEAAPPVLFVCTHGSRDPCCGKRGYAMVRRARERAPRREILESSHLGGHRFAPTVLALPEWRLFGRLEVDEVDEFLGLLERGRVMASRLRGACWLPPAAQVAEGAVLEVLPAVPQGVRVAACHQGNGLHRVDLEFRLPGGELRRYRVVVEEESFHAPASCSDLPGQQCKAMSRFRVRELQPQEELRFQGGGPGGSPRTAAGPA